MSSPMARICTPLSDGRIRHDFPKRMGRAHSGGRHKDWARRAYQVMAVNHPYSVDDILAHLRDRHLRIPGPRIEMKKQWSTKQLRSREGFILLLTRSRRFTSWTSKGVIFFMKSEKSRTIYKYEAEQAIIRDRVCVLETGAVSIFHNLELRRSERKKGVRTCRFCRQKVPTDEAIKQQNRVFCSDDCKKKFIAIISKDMKAKYGLPSLESTRRRIWKGYARIMGEI